MADKLSYIGTYDFGLTNAQTTTNSYVDLGTIWDKSPFREVTILIMNLGANSLTYKLIGSIDFGVTFDVPLTSDVAVAGTVNSPELVNIPVTHIKIQVKATTGSSFTTVKAKAMGYKN